MVGQVAGSDKSQRSGGKIEELISYAGPDRVVSWQEYLQDREKHKNKGIVFNSGFIELDYLVQGFQTGELYTVSGYTGMGKTLFLKSLIRSFGIGQLSLLSFSYEDAVERYLKMFREENASYPITVPLTLETGNLEWLEARIVESKLKFDTKVVTIDHLHYLMDMGHGKENMSLKIGSIMRFLKKKIAEDLNVIVFVVAHQEKTRDNQEASLDTIRDSSLIGQESDGVIIVQRMPDEKQKNKNDESFEAGYSMVKIDKARRSGIFRKRLTFKKQGNWLAPL